MQERLSTAKRVLYIAIVIACALAVLRILYNTGYAFYMSSEFYNDYMVWEKLSNQIYYSKVLKIVGKVLFYSGLAAVYAMWKKPRPNWHFVLLIAAALLPVLVSGTVRQLFFVDMSAWNFDSVFNIIPTIFSVVWTLARLAIIIRLYNIAEKYAKPVLLAYLVVISMGILSWGIAYLYGLVPEVILSVYHYIHLAVEIALYVITVICLKKKLGDNMPFTNTARFLKKECTNGPRIED